MTDTLRISLPDWLAESAAGQAPLATAQARVAFVVDLARRNVAHGGGPFAAAVFERDSGRLVAVGVNLVVASHCALAHAETLALSLAQQRLASHDLGAPGLAAHELVCSTEPCTMCLGAAVWSGVRRLVCGARDEDARAVGFDEGPKPEGWPAELAARGIEVVRDVLRPDAVAVLRDYRGPIYNPHHGPGAAGA